MLGEGVRLGVVVAPSRDAGLRLHALSKEKIHNPSSSFLKSITILITGNGGDVNQKCSKSLGLEGFFRIGMTFCVWGLEITSPSNIMCYKITWDDMGVKVMSKKSQKPFSDIICSLSKRAYFIEKRQ